MSSMPLDFSGHLDAHSVIVIKSIFVESAKIATPSGNTPGSPTWHSSHVLAIYVPIFSKGKTVLTNVILIYYRLNTAPFN